jgi:hypothetical protein
MIEFAKQQLGPETLFTLREVSISDLLEAEQNRTKAEPLSILDSQRDGLFEWYAILSKEAVYQVVRFGYFVRCDCKGFQHTKVCKHIALVFPAGCIDCGGTVFHFGDKCQKCFFKPKTAARKAATVY